MYSSTAPEKPPVLQVQRLSKRYGATLALREVSLHIAAGSIHGLLGENGAGKSTLVGMICGRIRPGSGHIYWQGQLLGTMDVRAMEQAGVFLVTQEPMLVEAMSAAENLLLGMWPQKRAGHIDWRALHAQAQHMLADSGVDPAMVGTQLNAVQRRKLNILRALHSGAKLVVLDEPTASLTTEERSQLFTFMRARQAEGVTFIFISHFNDEILEICDAVSVLRDGQLVNTCHDVQSLNAERLTALVLGRDVQLFQRQSLRPAPARTATQAAVQLRHIRSPQLDVPALNIAQGEIVGITGLPGAGGKELVRALFGLHAASGQIRFGTETAQDLPQHPADAYAAGIAWLSDDRRKDGAVATLPIAHNISLSRLVALCPGGWMAHAQEAELAWHWFGQLGIKAAGADSTVDTLSGGNQQKVCLARVLATGPRLLLLDEPTRGIDVGVKQEVLRTVSELSRQGMAVIIVSNDTDELVRAADRVLIFRQGRIQHELHGSALTQSALRAH